MNKKKYISIFILVATLNGCGDDNNKNTFEDKSEEPTWASDSVTYYAQDVIRHSNVSSFTYIDLEKNIESSDGSSASIVSVESLGDQAGCDVFDMDTTGFSVRTENVQSCHYRYTVGGKNDYNSTPNVTRATANVSMLVGSHTDSFTPISALTSKNTPITVNVEEELSRYGEIIPEGYELDNSIVITNSDVSNSVALASGNNIEYQPGFDFGGVERILYSFSNGSSIIHGDLDISVSSFGNTAPTADYISYTLDGGLPVEWGEEAYIDVRDYIYDFDGDELQLVDVYGYDSTLTIPEDYNANENYFDDTVFSFYSEVSGRHSITYVISDKKGGYAHGMIQLHVENVYKSILNKSSSGDDMYFTPPYTNDQAETGRISYIEGPVGDGNNALVGYGTAKTTFDVSSNICLSKNGRMPTSQEAKLLRDNSKNYSVFDEARWPENGKYWIYDVPSELATAQYAVIDMSTGIISEANNGDSFYSFCIESQPLSLFIEGASSIPVYSGIEEISESYKSFATFPDVNEPIDFDQELKWSFVVDVPNLARFDFRTRTLTSSPQTPEVGGMAHITACTKSNICGTKDVQLYTQLLQIPSDTEGLTESKSCEDIGYASINAETYVETFNSIYKPDTSHWLYEDNVAEWSSGLVVDIYGRIEPKEKYTRRVAEIQEGSEVEAVDGNYWTLIDTSYGPSHLICQY